MGVKISKSKTVQKFNCVHPLSALNRTNVIFTPAEFDMDVDTYVSPDKQRKLKSALSKRKHGVISASPSCMKPNNEICCPPCNCFHDVTHCPIHVKEALIPVFLHTKVASEISTRSRPDSPVVMALAPDTTVVDYHHQAAAASPPTPSNSSVSMSFQWEADHENESDEELFQGQETVYPNNSSALQDGESIIPSIPSRQISPSPADKGEEFIGGNHLNDQTENLRLSEEMAALAGNHARFVHEVTQIQDSDVLSPLVHVKPWINPDRALFHIPSRITMLPGDTPREAAQSLPTTPFRNKYLKVTQTQEGYPINRKKQNTLRLQVKPMIPTTEHTQRDYQHDPSAPMVSSLPPVEVIPIDAVGYFIGTKVFAHDNSLAPSDSEANISSLRRCQSATPYELMSATGFTNRFKPTIFVTSEQVVRTSSNQHENAPVSFSKRLMHSASRAPPALNASLTADPQVPLEWYSYFFATKSTLAMAQRMKFFKKCKSATFHMDGATYTIVAGGGTSKDDSTLSSSSGNGDLAKPETLTIVRRSGKKNITTTRNPTMLEDLDNITLESLELDIENTPVDTAEACDKSAFRLKCLLRLLQTKGQIPVETLQKNLEFASRVLDAVYLDDSRTDVPDPTVALPLSLLDSSFKTTPSATLPCSLRPPEFTGSTKRHKNPALLTRRFAEDEDELSEVQPDAVPPEVRAWLASTFTRHSVAPSRRPGDDKPKFRSVAQAIRAGIFVERIYRRMSSSSLLQFPPEVARNLKMIDEWSFDVFSLSEASGGSPLRYLGIDLLNRYGVLNKFKIPTNTLENFLTQVEAGYTKFRNLYHNSIHAADVCQTVSYILCQTGLMNWLTDLEIFAAIISAIIHDYEHTGQTNSFHIMSGSDTALLYNDRAVLENHHVCAAFKLMKEEDCNILVNLSREDFREFRSLVIDMVLATDMSGHFQQIKSAKALLTMPDVNIDKSKALSLMLHCCDVAHPGKPWRLHQRWTDLLLEEFFRQGDLEKEMGLPYSPLCDRNTTLVAESQIGFIDFIVEPSLTVMGDLLERILMPRSPLPGKNGRESISEENADNDSSKKEPSDKGKAMQPVNTEVTETESVATTILRPWKEHLAENKAKWKELSARESQNNSSTIAEAD